MVNYLLISDNYNKANCNEHTLSGEFLLKQLDGFPLILDASQTKLDYIKEYIRLHLNDNVKYVIYQDKKCSFSYCGIPSRINDFEKSIKKIAVFNNCIYENFDL